MSSAIAPCNCTANSAGNTNGATFQDERYGGSMRVHNLLPKSSRDADQRGRCTICSTERAIK